MKRWMFLLPVIMFVTSCTEDIKFNNPAFQTLKDNVFWRAQNYNAYIAGDGTMTVEGYLGYEKITLTTASPVVGTYILGVDDISTGYYGNDLPEKQSEFSTGTDKGNGQVIITEYNVENKTISGTFKFIAVNLNEEDTENPKVSLTEGVFYKVPLTAVLEN
jgi:hypothetical protein